MISFAPHPDLDVVLFEFIGEFTVEDYLQGMEQFLESEHFRPGVDSIWDFRQVSVRSVTAEVLMAVAEYNETLAQRRGDSWRVALVVSEEVAFGLSRMFMAYVESVPNDVNVFRAMEEAERWIAAG